MEGAAFIGGTDGARDGSDETREIVALGADFDARGLSVSGAFLKLFLHAREVYHLLLLLLLLFAPPKTPTHNHQPYRLTSVKFPI